jgi:hypothetical protein
VRVVQPPQREGEHPAIHSPASGLRERLGLAQALARIPPIGCDEDFERRQSNAEAADPLD